jgi:hypothetical protein
VPCRQPKWSRATAMERHGWASFRFQLKINTEKTFEYLFAQKTYYLKSRFPKNASYCGEIIDGWLSFRMICSC